MRPAPFGGLLQNDPQESAISDEIPFPQAGGLEQQPV
jgi:hypothetical protein